MKMCNSYIIRLTVLFVFFFNPANGQPSLQDAFALEGQTIFRDVKNKNTYYHLPFDYKLVTDGTGKPFFTLIHMRYTGKGSTGDAGVIKFNNLLQFKVAIEGAAHKKLNDLKISLKKINAAADLRVIPIKKFSSVLVFAGSGMNESGPGDSISLLKINASDLMDEKAAINNSYWIERIFSIRLTNADAQLVESALRNKQSILSFSYAIYSGFAENSPNIQVSGSEKLKTPVLDFFRNEAAQSDSSLHVSLVKADAVEIWVDINKWPTCIQKIDINERVPARYALFDVYCYDFNNELRPDLFLKKIEIKAKGVNGSEVITSHTFKSARPDHYSAAIHFLYAVRLDLPFYYRVIEFNNEGEQTITPWIERKEWHELLDITTPIEKRTGKKEI